MKSHSELQEAMERLQTDMGQKESELNLLRKDKWVYMLLLIFGKSHHSIDKRTRVQNCVEIYAQFWLTLRHAPQSPSEKHIFKRDSVCVRVICLLEDKS